jgi:hypothetical protein
MRIKITARGIYGIDGELPIGTELDVSAEPTGWAGRYIVIADAPADVELVTTDPVPVDPVPVDPVPVMPEAKAKK